MGKYLNVKSKKMNCKSHTIFAKKHKKKVIEVIEESGFDSKQHRKNKLLQNQKIEEFFVKPLDFDNRNEQAQPEVELPISKKHKNKKSKQQLADHESDTSAKQLVSEYAHPEDELFISKKHEKRNLKKQLKDHEGDTFTKQLISEYLQPKLQLSYSKKQKKNNYKEQLEDSQSNTFAKQLVSEFVHPEVELSIAKKHNKKSKHQLEDNEGDTFAKQAVSEFVQPEVGLSNAKKYKKKSKQQLKDNESDIFAKKPVSEFVHPEVELSISKKHKKKKEKSIPQNEWFVEQLISDNINEPIQDEIILSTPEKQKKSRRTVSTEDDSSLLNDMNNDTLCISKVTRKKTKIKLGQRTENDDTLMETPESGFLQVSFGSPKNKDLQSENPKAVGCEKENILSDNNHVCQKWSLRTQIDTSPLDISFDSVVSHKQSNRSRSKKRSFDIEMTSTPSTRNKNKFDNTFEPNKKLKKTKVHHQSIFPESNEIIKKCNPNRERSFIVDLQNDSQNEVALESEDFSFSQVMSQNNFEQLCDIEETVDFEIPPLHLVGNVTKKHKEKFAIQGIKICNRRYTKKEKEIVMKNLNEFCKLYQVKDSATLLGINSKRKNLSVSKFLKAKQFYVRLAKDLNNRTLKSVYRQARNMVHPCKNAKKIVSEIEINELKECYSNFGNDWVAIGEHMGRPADQCRKSYTSRFHTNTGRWSDEEEVRLANAVRTLIGDDLKNVLYGISKAPWKKIAELVRTRSLYKCHEHFLMTRWLIDESKRLKWKQTTDACLIFCFYKDNVEDITLVDWTSIYPIFKYYVPSYFALQRKWRELKYKFPEQKNKSHRKLINFLYKNYLPTIMKDKLLSFEDLERMTCIESE